MQLASENENHNICMFYEQNKINQCLQGKAFHNQRDKATDLLDISFSSRLFVNIHAGGRPLSLRHYWS